MWELIQSNKRKSVALIITLAVVLMLMGYAIGFMWVPEGGGIGGVLIAMVIWGVMMMVSFSGGEKMLLATAGAREVKKADAPQLFNIVEEITIAAGLPMMPKVFITDSPVPNAFAVGLKPERAAVAVTTGLLARLNRDELQGVIAHEIGHINNRDTLFMTLAGVTVGAVIIMADLFVRGLWFSGGRRRSSGKGNGDAIIMLIALVLAILSPLLAQMLYFACSRRREYLADASAAVYTRYPEGLASALQKISGMQSRKLEASRAIAPMYIVNPMAAHSRKAGLFSTHPPTADRIRVLREMTSDASLKAYEEAYRSIHKSGVVGARSLRSAEQLAAREASAGAKKDPMRGWRDAQDLLHKIDKYALLACACGVKLKVPSDFEHKTVTCPRCSAVHDIPAELFAAAAAVGAATGGQSTPPPLP